MPATYTLIASNTLSSNATSVTFSSIPATYTDLVLRYSARSAQAVQLDIFQVILNSQNTTGYYSATRMQGNGSAANSYRSGTANLTALIAGGTAYERIPGANATSNTFSSGEMYIPNYTNSSDKPISFFDVMEQNTVLNTRVMATAAKFVSTGAITTIKVQVDGSTNFVSGSSFFLYGIKNS